MAKKKILHIVNTHALNGGVGTVLNYLDEFLNQTNSFISSILKTHADEKGKFGYECWEKEGFLSEYLYSANFLEQCLKQYNLLHIHGVPSYRILEAIDSLKQKGLCPKIVNTCHSSVKKELQITLKKNKWTADGLALEKMIENGLGFNPLPFSDTYWGSAIYRQGKIMTIADKVQHMNKAYLDETVKEYLAEENRFKHVVVYNGINPLPDEKIKNLPKKKRLLYVGRFAPEKGIDELIEALPLVLNHHPDAEIRLVGGDKAGSLVTQYQKKTGDLLRRRFGETTPQYLKQITFTGWLSDYEELEKNYDWCDFLIVPSPEESFCLAIAESLNHQRIPIMASTPALNELYLSYDVGLSLNPKEKSTEWIAALANAINSAFNQINQDWLETMAQKGRQLVIQKYNLKEILKNQLEVYQSLIK